MKVGIDFGTTRTVVAWADRGNHPVVDFVDERGDTIDHVPSLVAAHRHGGELRFGLDALAVRDDPSFSTMRSFKRLLSRLRGASEEVPLGARVVRLDELAAGFLAHVREALEKRSNLRRKAGDREWTAAVGVPANAFAAQRLVTLEAFRRAGYAVGAIVNEPSAAGFEYTHRYRDTLTSRRDLVVVYDLGGGTFDASVVRMAGRHHEVLATAGLSDLGGDDFDAVLSEMALASAGLTGRDLPAGAGEAWLEQCRLAKEALHPSSRKMTLDLASIFGRGAPRPEVVLEVADYYEACKPLVQRSLDAMEPLFVRAEAEAHGGEEEIAGVYVVGGASELPVVGRALRERFGRRVHRSPYPSASVAIGLSIASDEGSDFRLVDRYSRTFGVFREADDGREVVLDPVFGRDAVLPGPSGPAVTTRSYRARHNIGHFRFFECADIDPAGKPRGDMALRLDVLFPFDEKLSARADLDAIPIERRGEEGARIVESYALDRNGLVHVSIRNADAGYERTYLFGKPC